MKIALFVLSCLAVVLATPVVKRQAHFGYQLPGGAELIVKSLQAGFSCANRIYGYYADVEHSCQVFHVCFPIVDNNEVQVDTAHYSFFCGNQTVFDQEHLVCVHETADFDCKRAPDLYDQVNQEFGRIPPK